MDFISGLIGLVVFWWIFKFVMGLMGTGARGSLCGHGQGEVFGPSTAEIR